MGKPPEIGKFLAVPGHGNSHSVMHELLVFFVIFKWNRDIT